MPTTDGKGEGVGRLILLYDHPELGEQRTELEEDRGYRIGSSPDNDIVISQKDISRHHAILRVRRGLSHITDLNSKNGTFVNGRRTASSAFQSGDTVHLSSARLMVEEEGSDDDPLKGDETDTGVAVSGGDLSEETMGYSGQASAEDMVSLLAVTSQAVRRGAVGEPLSWAVEHLGLEALVVLYRDEDEGVSLVSSAGDLGPLMRSSNALTALARDQKGQYAGTRITQLSEHGESLLVAPMRRRHMLVARFSGSPPAVGDLRAVIAAVEAVLCSGNPPQASPAVPGERRDPELRRFGNPLHRIAGLSEDINECKRRTAEFGQSDRAVLISGEAGTGKSLFARVIHDLSRRREAPFVVCEGAAEEDTTDSADRFAEALEAARGGTLFVRDLSAMSVEAQKELLDLLQPTAAGSTPPDVDLRVLLGVVGAMDRVRADGLLLDEFAGSLGGFRLTLPPLRDRPEDIPLLLTHFQREAGGRHRLAGSGFTVDALEALASYGWPENVRELRAEVLRLTTRAASDMILEVADLSPRIREGIAEGEVPSPDLGALVSKPLSDARADFERWMILRALYEEDWNQTRAADRLGLSRAGLFKKMRKLQLSGRDDRP